MSGAPHCRLHRRPIAVAMLIALIGAAPAAAARAPVPWLGQRPAKAATKPPLAPACRASDLRPDLFLQGATGSLVGGVDLRNVGARPCALVGRPTVSFAGAAAAAEPWQVKKLSPSVAPPDVLADPPGSLRALQPGKSARVDVYWSNWCGPGATATGAAGAPPDALVFGFAGGTQLSVPLTQAPRCDAPQDPSTVSVAAYVPTERRLPTGSRLPLAAEIVGARPVAIKPGLRAFRVQRGERLHYDVAVTNTSPMRFRFATSSCPAYVEQVAGRLPQVYVLNCRPAGSIGPRQTIVLAMEITIPATARLGNNSLTWELAPKTYMPPFVAAALWVVP